MGEPTSTERAPWAREVETHRLIGSRRWRVSDPRIPDDLRQALVDELMSARRAVRDAGDDEAAERRARDRVQDAKVALGERGQRWWRPDDDRTEVPDRIRRTHAALGRTPRGATVEGVAAITSQPAEHVAAVLDGG